MPHMAVALHLFSDFFTAVLLNVERSASIVFQSDEPTELLLSAERSGTVLYTSSTILRVRRPVG